eukprot:TRINITY_DN6849_c0_g1_i3.p1 TRINITY_DN6849_c0_g1~~TRINITY_DN6849_c0_g1_i3.p1  ORF type:complete len:471 (+),score=68.49 TRINITY_DN6849_c0_g1_i3:49-1413(+)
MVGLHQIIPQAVCSRYGLAVGANCAWFVHVLMALCFPVACPCGLLLDWLLGDTDKAPFRRSQLKALVKIHGQEAGRGGELTHGETSIIGGALDLTTKIAVQAMTPIQSVFSISVDAKLDHEQMALILARGYSRVPVFRDRPGAIVGLVLVNDLFPLRPEDEAPIASIAIRSIPRIVANMPLYNVLHEFQKGRSHIAAVVKSKPPMLLPSQPLKSAPVSQLQAERSSNTQRPPSFIDSMVQRFLPLLELRRSKHMQEQRPPEGSAMEREYLLTTDRWQSDNPPPARNIGKVGSPREIRHSLDTNSGSHRRIGAADGDTNEWVHSSWEGRLQPPGCPRRFSFSKDTRIRATEQAALETEKKGEVDSEEIDAVLVDVETASGEFGKPKENGWRVEGEEDEEEEDVIGIITLEDVLEELIQEEIVDETDEYIDVHRRIRVSTSLTRIGGKLSRPERPK